MNFDGLLQRVRDSFTSPSILANIVKGQTWNQDLPRFGGVAPESQMVQNPNVASPLQAPDEMTPGMVHKMNFEDLINQQREKQVAGAVAPPQNLWQKFSNAVREKVAPLGYDADTVIRQKALESGFGSSQFARERNNFGGIGAYDRDPNQAFRFGSIDEYLNYYLDLVKNRYPQAYENRADPEGFVSGLKEGGYASDPNYVWKVLNTPLARR